MMLFLVVIILAVLLGIIGAVVEGMDYLLAIGAVIFIAAIARGPPVERFTRATTATAPGPVRITTRQR